MGCRPLSRQAFYESAGEYGKADWWNSRGWVMETRLWKLLLFGSALALVLLLNTHCGSNLSTKIERRAIAVGSSRVTEKLEALRQVAASSGLDKSPVAAAPDSITEMTPIFVGSLVGWKDASWSAAVNFSSAEHAYSSPQSISFAATQPWGALSLSPVGGTFDTSPYTNLRFYINGGSAGRQKLGLALSSGNSWGPRVNISEYIVGGAVAANEWRLVDIPLSSLGMAETPVDRMMLQDVSGGVQPTIYLDSIAFYQNGVATEPATPPVEIAVNVDAAADEHPISPLVYGIAAGNGAEPWQKEMGASVVRWGGNARTRHNWEINTSNTGSDWFFTNVDQGDAGNTPGKASHKFVSGNRALGMESFLTIPTIGWVAKDNTSKSTGVPKQGAPPSSTGSEAIDGYDPTANRNTTSVRSYARKGSPFAYPPSATDNAVFQDEWVNYLVNSLGDAQNGGARFYAMDNEPDLWANNTHVDIHPATAGYDEMLERFLEYAEAIKAVDPSAEVTGPVIWGWPSLWYSALDRGTDNFATHADRTEHDNVPFLQWYLRQVKAHDDSAGHRTLDVLDVHWYPQVDGVFSGALDPKTRAARLRSTRSLWDAGYADESWMARTEGGPYLRLIPRLREMIAAEYPGLKIGITEWNFGADKDINGALAIGEALGIFGREGVYLANYWTSPANGSPGYWAWRMYRNYDGAYSRFGDVSVRAQTSDDYKVSAYASKDSSTGELKVMLINKMPDAGAQVNVNVGGFGSIAKASAYRLSKQEPEGISPLDVLEFTSNQGKISLPPYSMTLVVLQPAAGE